MSLWGGAGFRFAAEVGMGRSAVKRREFWSGGFGGTECERWSPRGWAWRGDGSRLTAERLGKRGWLRGYATKPVVGVGPGVAFEIGRTAICRSSGCATNGATQSSPWSARGWGGPAGLLWGLLEVALGEFGFGVDGLPPVALGLFGAALRLEGVAEVEQRFGKLRLFG
jgi:hypothetical protein